MLHSVICYSGPAPLELSPVVHSPYQCFPLHPEYSFLQPAPKIFHISRIMCFPLHLEYSFLQPAPKIFHIIPAPPELRDFPYIQNTPSYNLLRRFSISFQLLWNYVLSLTSRILLPTTSSEDFPYHSSSSGFRSYSDVFPRSKLNITSE
ncbi:hypothetical protein BYT27DRAFT_6365471 [Phlegmacium glaucopus]|nr:hypothetical protein BYT27DRAFT_6365471 [Phlegmacium glaucopus]